MKTVDTKPMADWKFLLVFTGEAPDSFLLDGLEAVRERMHAETGVDFAEDLLLEDNWIYDDDDEPFRFSSGLGEVVYIDVYRVKNLPAA